MQRPHAPWSKLRSPARLEPIVERVPLGRTARSGWDGLQPIAASLQSGYGSAATSIERHGSAARGNPVYECGTLVGKVMRSLFMLDYLVNPEFRREVHRLLAQGELLHALHKGQAAFFQYGGAIMGEVRLIERQFNVNIA